MTRPEALAMAEVVKANAPRLKAEGFRKRRYGFNRATTDGLVQVVHFWMAPFEPPAWTEVPGLRERRYGGFRIDLGVWVPEMTRGGTPLSNWINAYDCQLQTTIGSLLDPGGPGDFWWNLSDPTAADAAASALDQHALPWLERFPSRGAILDRFESDGPLGIGMSPAGPLDIAELYESLGRTTEARRTLENYVHAGVHQPHAAYLSEYLTACGYADLVTEIRILS